MPALAGLAVLTLVLLWLGPLPELARRAFTAHMTIHMGVVAVASPLLAVAVGDTRADPVRRWPALIAPVPAALAELVVVWGWHAPALHHAARRSPEVFALEQTSFLLAGLVVWLSAFGGHERRRRERAGAGALGLLLTSMHMTLLGALLTLSPRPLYGHTGPPPWNLSALEDQHLGGAVMLVLGGAVYLAGGVTLVKRMLRDRSATGESA